MNVSKRSKGRTVVVQQSPVTTEERRKHLLATNELEAVTAERDRLQYGLDAAQQDYEDLELLANRKLDAAERRLFKVAVLVGVIAFGMGAVLSRMAW